MSNDIVLELPPTPRNARNSEATFVTLKSGRILYAWSKFTSASNADDGAAVIAGRYSDDGGRTWSRRDEILVTQEGTTNVMSPSLLRLQDGRIALLYLRKDGDDLCMPWIRFSRDEARTFTKPALVTPVPGYYVVNNDRLVQLRSGRILVPAGHHRMRIGSEPFKKNASAKVARPFLASPALILCFFSDDGGKTWLESLTNYYVCSKQGRGLQEPGVVELKNGDIWAWSRSGMYGSRTHDYQWESYSRDGGQVWSAPEPALQFPSPCSPMQVKRIPATGHLFAVWNDHSGHFKTPKPKPISWGRTPLVSAISKDEGRTWRHHLLLEKAPDHGFCYPAVHFTAEAALLSYNAGGASSKMPLDTQRVRRITYDALYAAN